MYVENATEAQHKVSLRDFPDGVGAPEDILKIKRLSVIRYCSCR